MMEWRPTKEPERMLLPLRLLSINSKIKELLKDTSHHSFIIYNSLLSKIWKQSWVESSTRKGDRVSQFILITFLNQHKWIDSLETVIFKVLKHQLSKRILSINRLAIRSNQLISSNFNWWMQQHAITSLMEWTTSLILFMETWWQPVKHNYSKRNLEIKQEAMHYHNH